ncbi:late competence protein ComER [Paenibacillus sediminis]|uniref:Pyrroline-5-carboxylate reductase n=1 Tax=Paenibacillus sediminis TaxID=664909 RepID=A0ABS4GYL0_9BACL|nr:late competence protein ComER [Paenibacillus sediminis]MBP1935356.1 competence protein ComER [Paenibacillus sediminis]
MKVGFIGTGTMGSILIDAFIRSGALEPQQIVASNRTKPKLQQLSNCYPGLKIACDNIEVASSSQILFICVKPLEFKKVIDDIRSAVTNEQIVISITSPVQIKHLESRLSCKIAKVIPSITNSARSGASLCIYGSRITREDRLLIEQLISHISTPIVVRETHTRITSDISSCGPAFLAFFLEKWIDAAVEMTGIERSSASFLAAEMLLGTGKLLTEGGYSLEELQRRVTVPGGITAEGLSLLSNNIGDVFHQLIRVTHDKYEEDIVKINDLFSP